MKGKSPKEKRKRRQPRRPDLLSARLLRTDLFFPFSFFTFSFFTYRPIAPIRPRRSTSEVRYKSAAGMKDLPRKRFFLIAGSLDQTNLCSRN
jgi:hypothetical protein